MEEELSSFVKFQQREGHSLVPKGCIEGGINLHCCLDTQQQQKKKGYLKQRFKKRLKRCKNCVGYSFRTTVRTMGKELLSYC